MSFHQCAASQATSGPRSRSTGAVSPTSAEDRRTRAGKRHGPQHCPANRLPATSPNVAASVQRAALRVPEKRSLPDCPGVHAIDL